MNGFERFEALTPKRRCSALAALTERGAMILAVGVEADVSNAVTYLLAMASGDGCLTRIPQKRSIESHRKGAPAISLWCSIRSIIGHTLDAMGSQAEPNGAQEKRQTGRVSPAPQDDEQGKEAQACRLAAPSGLWSRHLFWRVAGTNAPDRSLAYPPPGQFII